MILYQIRCKKRERERERESEKREREKRERSARKKKRLSVFFSSVSLLKLLLLRFRTSEFKTFRSAFVEAIKEKKIKTWKAMNMQMKTRGVRASAAGRSAASNVSRFARGSASGHSSLTRSVSRYAPAHARQVGKGLGLGQKNRSTCVVTFADASGEQQTIVIGLAADSGCGKSTFMRRVTQLFGGKPEPPKGKSSLKIKKASAL